MKRFHSIQIVVIAAFLVVSFFSTLRLGAQGGDPGQDYTPPTERRPEKHVVVLIDNSRSVAIYNGQMGGPINEVADFTQFLVRYLRVFEPDAHIGVRVFANGAEDIDIILDSRPALEWTDREIDGIEPLLCPSVGTSPDPCDTRIGPPDSTDTVAMVIALDWAVGQLSQCQGEPSAVDCSILVFTDGRYERIGGSLETISVAEKLREISNNLPVRIIPFGVGNHQSNARNESPQILDPDLYQGINTQTWREIWQQAFISPTVDINSYFPNPSNFSTGRHLLLQRFKAVMEVPDNIEVESVETRSILRPIDPLLEPSLYPHINGVHLKVAYPPSVSISSPLLSNRPTGSELILERTSQIESINAIAEGRGFIAYQFQLITIDPHVDIRLEPQTIHEDSPITLTVALTTPYDVLGSRWIRSIQANLQPVSRYPQLLNLGWDQSAQVWVRTLNEGLPSDVYTVTFEVIPNSEWSNSWPSLPLQKTFVVEAPRWTYELALLESTVASEQLITITLKTFRNGEPYPLPENVLSIKVEFERHDPSGRGSNQMLQADQISKLGDGIILDGLKDTGTYTVSAEIKLDNGRTFDVIPQILNVVLAPPPVVADPTPTLTNTPTPLPTATPSHTATPYPTATATVRATATETSIPAPTATLMSTDAPGPDTIEPTPWNSLLKVIIIICSIALPGILIYKNWGWISSRFGSKKQEGHLNIDVRASIDEYIKPDYRFDRQRHVAQEIVKTYRSESFRELIHKNEPLQEFCLDAVHGDDQATNLIFATLGEWIDCQTVPIALTQIIHEPITIQNHTFYIYDIFTKNLAGLLRLLDQGSPTHMLDKEFKQFLEWGRAIEELESDVRNRKIWVGESSDASSMSRLSNLLDQMSTEGYTPRLKSLKMLFDQARKGKEIEVDDVITTNNFNESLSAVETILRGIRSKRASSLWSDETLRWLKTELDKDILKRSHEGRLLKLILFKIWLVED